MLKNKLIALRNQTNLDKKDVATKIGVTYHTYLNYEKGKTVPDSTTLKNIGDLYQVSTDFLLDRGIYENNQYSQELNKTFYENAKELLSAKNQKVVNTYEKYSFNHDLNKPPIVGYEVVDYNWFEKGQRYISIRQTNNDMAPEVKKGDSVIVKLKPDFVNNDIVLVQIDNEPAIIRRIVRKDNILVLYAVNSSIRENQVLVFSKDDSCKIIGVVVELRRRYSKV